MNHPLREDFEAEARRIVHPMAASARRKRIMHEELLGHMLGVYDEEQAHLGDDRAAVAATKRRLGNADELRLQLQASVPFFERVLFLCLSRKEIFMSRWLLIVGLVTIVVGRYFHFSGNEQVLFGGMALLCGVTFRHLCQKDNIASRWIGPRWPWLVGCVVVLFGTGIILPALAKLRHGPVAVLFVEAAILGTLITLAGLRFIASGVKSLRERPA